MKKRLSGIFTLIVILGTPFNSPAQAAPGDSVALYFSAPFVTGSHVTEGAATETFNSFSSTCPTTWAVGSASVSGCTINNAAGTSTGNSEPAIGVPLTKYLATSGTLNTTVTFSNQVKYVGFWWMMGSSGNNVDFLDTSGTVLASLDANDIMTFLGANNLVTNADTRTVTRVDGQSHVKKHYYRSPANYTGTVANPVMDYDTATYANEPWVYLNLFVSGSLDVKKVKFSGTNFEIDNLTVSTVESGPRGDMVLVKNVLGTPPAAQVVSWAPTNTSITGGSNNLTPDSSAIVTTPNSGGGNITYSVVSPGTSGCTVNLNTGVITYSAAGTCVVRATAAAVSGYYAASRDASFTFTSAPTVIEASSSNSTGVTPIASEVQVLANTGFNEVILAFALAFVLFGTGFVNFSRRLLNRN